MERPVSHQLTFGDIATAYARDVAEGRIVSCKWHRLACERHLRDLERSAAGTLPYLFNPALTDKDGKKYFPAERICKFAQLMPHIKGDWAARGERIKLEDWQVFILASAFGWVHQVTKKRRFRVFDLYVPRKNAKSTIAAVVGLYMLAVDGEFGAEVYSGATSEKQALEVFRPAMLMAKSTLSFCQRYGVIPNASNLSIADTNSKFEPVIGKPGDGASPSLAIVDEYHEHKTPELYDTMKTGMMARSQPMLLTITTAGSDISGPCYMHQVELQKILEGVIENENRFGIIFTIDDGDKWETEAALVKANPNFGISIDRDIILADMKEAIEDTRNQSAFKTKHLNIWVAAASPWLNLFNLQKAGDSTLHPQSQKWDGAVIGADLASKSDIASLVALCWTGYGDTRKYYAFSRNYVPEIALRKPENAKYQTWATAGHLIVTPGNMISLQTIQEDALQLATDVGASEFAKDPWGGHQMGANLEEEGLTVVDIPQQVRYLSEPMKEIAAVLDDGRFFHDDNQCYVWQLSNVECQEDRNENIFPHKSRDSNKIDAALATIIAMNRALAAAEAENIIDNTFTFI